VSSKDPAQNPNPVAAAQAALSILNAVVVLQPISDKRLGELFPSVVSATAFLSRSRLIRRLPDKCWVATSRGLSFRNTKEMGRKRDVLRMFSLIEMARRGTGGHGPGDAPLPVVKDPQ
jgi:hypothetical protein